MPVSCRPGHDRLQGLLAPPTEPAHHIARMLAKPLVARFAQSGVPSREADAIGLYGLALGPCRGLWSVLQPPTGTR